jgi:hypothetical protein
VRAAQSFPTGARVTLVWGAGVATTTGVPTTAEQRLAFQARPAFTVDFSCLREQRGAACNPVGTMRVDFSAPVARLTAEAVALVGADGAPRPHAKGDPDANLVSSVSFPGPFPENATFRVELPAELRDESARVPINAGRYPLTVATGELPPLAKFNARFGIVESKAGATLPVTLRNLEPEARARVHAPGTTGNVLRITPEHEADILPWLRRVGTAKREESIFAPPTTRPRSKKKGGEDATPAPTAAPQSIKTFTLPKPGGERAFEVVGIPFEAPGLYVVELERARLGASLLAKPRPMYVPTAALITNLSVLRVGPSVGRLGDDARRRAPGRGRRGHDPRLQGAVVRAGRPTPTGSPASPTCRAPRAPDLLASGLPEVDPFDGSQTLALRELYDGLLVTARSGDDLSFVHSSWDDGIEPWRYQLPDVDENAGIAAHSILDRPLFRAGETVHMKHLFRAKRLHGFGAPTPSDLPTTLSIVHVGSEHLRAAARVRRARGRRRHLADPTRGEARLLRGALPLRRDGEGAHQGENAGGEDERSTTALQHRRLDRGELSRRGEFRVPMKGVVSRRRRRSSSAPRCRSTGRAVPRGAPRVGSGRRARAARAVHGGRARGPRGFVLANGWSRKASAPRRRGTSDDSSTTPKIHQRLTQTLDAAGTGRAVITDLKPSTTPVTLRTELEFRDPTGQVQTVASSVPIWPAERLVAIAPDRGGAGDAVGARVGVIDVAGKPVAGADVQVDAFSRKIFSHRTRVVGGFYAYDSVTETKGLGTVCRGKTDARGMFRCDGTLGVTGNVVLQASTSDGAGRRSAAHDDVWVAGDTGDWWFGGTDSDRMDVLPERRHYEPGETARLQVRMPFRAATALVSIEREGVIEREGAHAETRCSTSRSSRLTRRTSSSRCWRSAAAPTTCSRRHSSTSDGRPSSSASRSCTSAGRRTSSRCGSPPRTRSTACARRPR